VLAIKPVSLSLCLFSAIVIARSHSDEAIQKDTQKKSNPAAHILSRERKGAKESEVLAIKPVSLSLCLFSAIVIARSHSDAAIQKDTQKKSNPAAHIPDWVASLRLAMTGQGFEYCLFLLVLFFTKEKDGKKLLWGLVSRGHFPE